VQPQKLSKSKEMRKNAPESLPNGRFWPIFVAMERNAKLQNSWNPFSDRNLAAEVLGAWGKAARAAGLSGKRKVDDRRTILGAAAMSGSGFAYPGVVSGIPSRKEDVSDDQENDRTSSFNETNQSK
jgi:hypothetical protein